MNLVITEKNINTNPIQNIQKHQLSPFDFEEEIENQQLKSNYIKNASNHDQQSYLSKQLWVQIDYQSFQNTLLTQNQHNETLSSEFSVQTFQNRDQNQINLKRSFKNDSCSSQTIIQDQNNHQQMSMSQNEFIVQFKNQQVLIKASQTQRQYLNNLIKNKKMTEYKNLLQRLAITQGYLLQQNFNILDEQILFNQNFKGLKSQNRPLFTRDNFMQKSLILNFDVQNDHCMSSYLSKQEIKLKRINQVKVQSQNDQGLILNQQGCRKFNFQNSDNKLFGGGCSISHGQKVQNPQKLNKENFDKILNLKEDEYFRWELSQNQNQNENQVQKKQNKRKNFNSHYEVYFTNEKVDEEEIETHIRLMVEEALFRYREQVVSQAIRYKVIDLINLIINYFLIIIQRNSTASIQQDIDELGDKLKIIKKYCEENRKRYPCLELYQYVDILISLNSQRQGLDKVNQSKIYKLAEKILQVVKFGAGFVSIAGAVQNLSKINLEDIQKFIKEAKEIFAELTSSQSQDALQIGQEAYTEHYRGSLSNKIITLWMRKIQAIGDNILDTQQEAIFYLEELDKMQNKDDQEITLFVYMQLNYLLLKEQKNDNLMLLSKKLTDLNKQNIIFDFANKLQLKEYQKGIIDHIKNIANLIASSEQFRYLKCSLLLHLSQVIYNFGNKKKEYHSIMIDLCLNYLQEKEISVKIIYKGNQKMAEYIHNIDQYKNEIINESKQLKKQMTLLVGREEEVNKIVNNIETQEDIPKLLAQNFVQMWEVSIKQRQDQHKIAHKDDALLEAINLYIKQQVTQLDGYQLIQKDNQTSSKNSDAIKLIIEHFLIPNYVNTEEDIGEAQSKQKEVSVKFPCKILSILADGGAGKSMLLKKLEVELLKVDSEYVRDHRAEYIPFIIKCNSLNTSQPSIEKYLEQQNLKMSEIEILKKSQKNKLIMLDGYDEYAGNYFKVYQDLKIYEWTNTIVIVTSRLENITVSDAKFYFNYFNQNDGKEKTDQFSILKLEKMSHSDVHEYFQKFSKQMETENKEIFNEDQYGKFQKIIFENKQFVQLLKLPINLYLTTRMILDLNLNDQDTLNTFRTANDQIEIQELFFQQSFQYQSEQFIQQFNLDREKQEELIQKVKQSYFQYFQSIAMHMFKQKGAKTNFLAASKQKINFQLPSDVLSCLKKYKIKAQQLTEQLSNYVDSRVITRIQLSLNNIEGQNNQDEEDQNEQILSNQEFEFRHKSIFEYFAARAMKFDFDVHKENIHQLPLETLQKFNINQLIIMNSGYNQSEQQILLKLFRLIDHDKRNVDYTINYNSLELKDNNRYFQYIKRSQIQTQDQKSTIDIGSSNLLSALFISRFSFEDLTLSKCSISKLYNQNNKQNDIVFDQCNLNNALLRNMETICFESSYTDQSSFHSLQTVFSTDNVYSFSQFVFKNDTIIFIGLQGGYVSKFKVNNQLNKFKQEKRKRISCTYLQSIKIFSNDLVLICGITTIFFISIKDLKLQKIKRFDDIIQQVDVVNNEVFVQLINNQSFIVDADLQIKQIEIEGSSIKLSNNSNLLVTNKDDKLIIYNRVKQNFQKSQEIQDVGSVTAITFSEDSKYLAVSINNLCKIWNTQKGFELIKTIEADSSIQISSMSFSSDGKYFATGSSQTSEVMLVEKEFKVVKIIQSDEGPFNQLGFSSNSKYLAFIYLNQTCRIFSSEKDFELYDTIQGHCHFVNSVAFSQNNRYIATTSEDKTCKIWDIEKDYELVYNIQGHSNALTAAKFSPFDKYLVTSSDDGTCKVWNPEKSFELISTIQIQNEQIQDDQYFLKTSIDFSSDGKYLVVGSIDSTCKIFNVQKQFELHKTIKCFDKNPNYVYSVAFSQDCKYLAASCLDFTCKIWDIQNDFQQIHSIQAHSSIIYSIAFSPDGKYFATGSKDGTYKIWNPSNNFELITSIQTFSITSLAFSADSKYFVTSFSEATSNFQIWSTEKGFEKLNSIKSHIQQVTCSVFSNNGMYLATSSNDFTCKIWNLQNSFEVINQIQGHTDPIDTLDLSSNGKYLATGSQDHTIKIWDILKNFELITTIKAHNDPVTKVVFSENSKYLASSSWDQICKIWNVEQDFELFKVISDGFSKEFTFSFTNDSKYLITGSFDTLKMWSVDSDFKIFNTVKSEKEQQIQNTAISADGKYLAVTFRDVNFQVWKVEKGFQLFKTIQGNQEQINAIAFAQNCKYLASGTYDGTVMIWNQQTEFELIYTLQTNTYCILSLLFSLDSNYLLSSFFDCELKVWQINNDFELTHTIQSISKGYNSMKFSKDGKYFVTGSNDSTCKIYNPQKILLQSNDKQNPQENNQLDIANKNSSHQKQDSENEKKQNKCLFVL